ncbi:MAG: NADPH-dependent reductase [Candidatus Saccharibacteria bacterium]|nr:NADPH-dependent reductase [Candidatus Saccharibacteria bacterium]
MKIQLIIGSTRPGRVGPQIADWLVANLPTQKLTEYEIVDITDYNLPLLDEPIHPAMNQYTKAHTKAWSQKIKEADGYIFLTPEYNASFPAALKNAIDYLYHEWTDKPTMIASYGVRGGQGASTHLRDVVELLKMRPTGLSPAFTITRDMSGEDGKIKNISEAFEPYLAMLKEAGDELLSIGVVPEAVIA